MNQTELNSKEKVTFQPSKLEVRAYKWIKAKDSSINGNHKKDITTSAIEIVSRNVMATVLTTAEIPSMTKKLIANVYVYKQMKHIHTQWKKFRKSDRNKVISQSIYVQEAIKSAQVKSFFKKRSSCVNNGNYVHVEIITDNNKWKNATTSIGRNRQEALSKVLLERVGHQVKMIRKMAGMIKKASIRKFRKSKIRHNGGFLE